MIGSRGTIAGSLFVVAFGLAACGPKESKDGRKDLIAEAPSAGQPAGQEALMLNAITNYYAEPLSCDAYHSKNYYCDGYTQKNTPLKASDANETEETESSTAPASGYIGLQVIGSFQSSRPSIVYIHGWNVEGSGRVFGFPDQWAQQANLAGYNVLQFHWSDLAYDNGEGCPGFGWFGFGNEPCNVAHSIYKSNSAADRFLEAYKARFSGTTGRVRIVAQSLGAPLAIYASYRMFRRSDFNAVTKPSRIDLIDPFITIGLGGDRNKPYDGQIPPDTSLPSDYRSNIVTSFVSGSSCRSTWTILPPNHMSQYCQNEGMAFRLVRDNNVGMIVFSSIVGGATAQDFSKVMMFQAFSGSAFRGDLLTRHVAPNASYFYSFAPGTPPGGFDASSSDSAILQAARDQAVNRINRSLKQTSGFDTITLMDDAYVPR